MSNNRKFIEEFMEATNLYRKRHGVEPLTLNKDISKISQKWADKLSGLKSIKHQDDPRYKGKELGENIAIRFNSSTNYYSGHRAVGQWYKEINDYSFETNSGPKTGHFTQLVWKDSKEVGVGRAQASDGKWIVVANYLPAGNYIGRYDRNVFPPKNNDTSLLWSPEDKEEESDEGEKDADYGPSGGETSVRTVTTTKITRMGSSYMIEDTTKITKTMADGSTSTSTKTVSRPATKDEIKKLKR